MTLSGERSSRLLNTLSVLRVLSIFPFACSLRTELHAVNVAPVPATIAPRSLLGPSAWEPFVQSFAQGSFVALGETEAERGRSEPPPTARPTSSAAPHWAPASEQRKEQGEQNSSPGAQTSSSTPMYAALLEEPSEGHKEESHAHADTVLGKGKSSRDLTDEELRMMTPREGLIALLSQGKDLVTDVKGTLDGFDAVVSLRKVTQKLREEIQKDVQALNRTISEEFANIDELRKLQEAQTAVLRSQLSFLMPKHGGMPEEAAEGRRYQPLAAGAGTVAALHGFSYIGILVPFAMEIVASILLI